MKTRTYFILSLLGICALASCSPRIVSNISKQFPAMGPSENVSVLLSSDELPENSIMLGRVKVSSRYLTTGEKGTLDNVLDKAVKRSREIGGNAIVLVGHKSPSPSNNGKHSIEVEVYRTEAPIKEVGPATDHPEYASIWIYRYRWFPDLVYNVFLGDKRIFTTYGGAKTEVRIYEPGAYKIWARGEKESSVTLNVERGKDYYIEASIGPGIFFPNPRLFPVSDVAGKVAVSEILNVVTVDNE